MVEVGLRLNALSREERSYRDNDTAFRLIQANNRSLRDIDGDRLWTLANARDDIDRRRLHSIDRLRSRRMHMESEFLSQQVDRILAESSAPIAWDHNIDFQAFERLAALDNVRRRIEIESVRERPESDEVVLHVGLKTAQQYLEQNEALISATGAGDSMVSVCVRRDREIVVATPFDSNEFTANMLAIQQELQFRIGRRSNETPHLRWILRSLFTKRCSHRFKNASTV